MGEVSRDETFLGGGQFSEEEVYFRMYLYSNEKEEMSALKLFSVSVHRCKFTHSTHRCETLQDGEALCPGCEIQKPAAVQQKYRYDLNDLYGVFLENRDSRAQRSLIVLCAFCKGFPDTHTFCRSA